VTDPPLREWPVLEPDWPAPPGIRAVVTLRQGGVSQPPFDTLNVGTRCGDAPEAVTENRRRIREALRLPSEPCWLTQVHGADVVSLGGSLDPGGQAAAPPCADAAVTRAPGRVCAIQVADCMPVLFAARDGVAVGASHAGWRGLAAGVLQATVRALAVEPSELLAWMGPAIGPQHFEVGDDVRTALLAVDAGVAPAFTPNSRGRWQCDLYAVARRQLEAAGVREVHGGGWCTFADPARFFSYRRDGRCGRMAALLWMEDGALAPRCPDTAS
jgi:purine-nucleoside/S-methyl-5'-thioadenosine phosphorylase / adenosine deaminase